MRVGHIICDAVFTLHTCHHSQVLQPCRGAEADNLTVRLSCYISQLTHITHPFPLTTQKPIVYGGAALRLTHLPNGEWMLHVMMMTSRDVLLWFIFELQAAV